MSDQGDGERRAADPGWRPVLTPSTALGLVAGLVPLVGRRILARRIRHRFSSLLFLRQLFVQFAVAIALIGVVVLLLAGDFDDSSGLPVAVGLVVAAGIAFVAGAEWAGSRPLVCEDDQALVGSYTTRFFLRVAFGESAALVGFVAVLVTGRSWLYLLGAAFTVAEFVRLAPTASNIAADQRRLDDADCPRDLLTVLAVGPPGPSKD